MPSHNTNVGEDEDFIHEEPFLNEKSGGSDTESASGTAEVENNWEDEQGFNEEAFYEQPSYVESSEEEERTAVPRGRACDRVYVDGGNIRVATKSANPVQRRRSDPNKLTAVLKKKVVQSPFPIPEGKFYQQNTK